MVGIEPFRLCKRSGEELAGDDREQRLKQQAGRFRDREGVGSALDRGGGVATGDHRCSGRLGTRDGLEN